MFRISLRMWGKNWLSLAILPSSQFCIYTGEIINENRFFVPSRFPRRSINYEIRNSAKNYQLVSSSSASILWSYTAQLTLNSSITKYLVEQFFKSHFLQQNFVGHIIKTIVIFFNQNTLGYVPSLQNYVWL